MMIILIINASLFLIAYFGDDIYKFFKSIFIKLYTHEPNKDSKFRLLKRLDDRIYIQFSNNNGKKYYDYGSHSFSNEKDAKEFLHNIILNLNKIEKTIYEYDPNCLRITDGSEKEFEEI